MKVLLASSHPVQYAAPLYRLYSADPRLDVTVAYCSLQGAKPGVDSDFGMMIAWDVPLLDGHRWVCPPNHSPQPGLRGFFGLVNPGLWRLIRTGGFEAVVAYTGYRCASFWIAAAAAKMSGATFLFGTDAHGLRPLDGRRWKIRLKRWLWPRLFRLADVVIVPSSGGVRLMEDLGIPPERIVLTPYVVDNAWWQRQAQRVDRKTVRRQWGIPDDSVVVLFCAKLVPWKRPLDVLRAFAMGDATDAYLVFAGEGPLRAELEPEAGKLRLAGRVRFLGFVNQSGLPAVYRASDLLVLPSDYEPFGVVVNEAMLCGCPVVVSDRVGARYDLVRQGETGFVYPCGDVGCLANILGGILADRDRLRRMGEAAQRRMETWSPRENTEALILALERAVAFKQGGLPGGGRA